MNAMHWLFGHDFAWFTIGVFLVAAIASIVLYHFWLMPRARELALSGNPEGYAALAGMWKTLYPAAACNLAIAVIGIIYHSQL